MNFGSVQGSRKSDQRVPMIGHDHERTEIDALVLHGEGERVDDDLPKVRPKYRFLWSQRFCDEENRRNIPQAVKTQILGMGV